MATEHDSGPGEAEQDVVEKARRAARERAAKRKARDPEKFKAQAIARQKRYWEKKRATITPEEAERLRELNRQRNAKYRDKDRERYRKRTREGARRRYAADPTKNLDAVHRLRAKKRLTKEQRTAARRKKLKAGKVTAADWRAIKKRYGDCCAYCGAGGVRLTMDHVQSIKRGGLHVPENVVPACKTCNCRKGDRPATGRWTPRLPPEATT